MTLWQRICAWFARPDPDDMDSGFPADSTGPIPQDLYVPGPDTHKMMTQQFSSPSDWDALSDRRNKRSKG